MVTITHTNTAKLKERIFKQEIEKIKGLYPDKEYLTKAEAEKVDRLIYNHIRAKESNFYLNQDQFEGLDHTQDIIRELKEADSTAEEILYKKLTLENIPFHFQYPVGPYCADFLVKEILDLELDGPQHKELNQREHDVKRDKYFMRMGYKVLRVPIWLVSLDEQAVFEEILEITK